jgi:type II restriction enzyme
MNYSNHFDNRIGCQDSQAVLDYFYRTLKKTITRWDYFVNWAKVFGNVGNIEKELNLLNYLIGKDNIEQEFLELIKEYPSIIKLIPILVACREKHFEILTNFENGIFTYDFFQIDTKTDPKSVLVFAQSIGFLELLKSKRIKSVVDYVIGVEVGLDSNGRKNRGGTSMESIIEFFVKDVCQKNRLQYMPQADAKKIRQNWGLTLNVDKSERKIDFAVKKQNKLILIETNFYGGGGSKLKATAGEYKSMFDFWKSSGNDFIWITDGKGWETTKRPLEETFNHINYILNLDMVSKGLLEDIIINAE